MHITKAHLGKADSALRSSFWLGRRVPRFATATSEPIKDWTTEVDEIVQRILVAAQSAYYFSDEEEKEEQ